jgi:hypothetical protein
MPNPTGIAAADEEFNKPLVRRDIRLEIAAIEALLKDALSKDETMPLVSGLVVKLNRLTRLRDQAQKVVTRTYHESLSRSLERGTLRHEETQGLPVRGAEEEVAPEAWDRVNLEDGRTALRLPRWEGSE